MKGTLLTIAICCLTSCICVAQNQKVPRNLNQALKILQTDCPDSLKSTIKKTADNKLADLVYPQGNYDSYKTIYNWISDDYEDVRIDKYLKKKGISRINHQEAVILIAFKDQLLGIPVNEKEISKSYQTIEARWNKEDKVRSTTDTLRGHYIPKDIEDCFKRLDRMFKDSDKVKAKAMTEDEFTGEYYMGLGFRLMGWWWLGGGSRISVYFNKLGVTNNESMAGIILDSYYRHLKGKPIDLEGLVKKDKAFWADSQKKRLEEQKKEFDTYKIGDTLEFKYNHGYVSKQQEANWMNNRCKAKGVVLARDTANLWIKVKIIESCDRKGLIVYDRKDSYSYDKKLKRWVKFKKHKIKKAYNDDELWFLYSDWYSDE